MPPVASLLPLRPTLLSLILAATALGCAEPSETPNPTGTGGSIGTTGSGGVTATGGQTATGGTGAGGTKASGGTTGAGGSGTGGLRGACTAPANYRNLFVELLGKTPGEVDTKVMAAVQQMFHGNTNQTIYFELGADQAYIQDTGNNDVRSEGVSYGMIIAVQLDMKAEFDKLWKFASARMLQPNGLFAWQLNTSGGIISSGDAPDGDEYFAMALLLASRRWGDATGTDYAAAAKKSLKAMATQNVFSSNPAVVRFGPNIGSTDASYVLPLFYSEWACFDPDNATLWKNATTYARTFFQKAADATTGLAPDRQGLDGSPMGNYGSDAIRVPMNIMMDLNLNNADPWQATTYAPRLAAFWTKEGLANYGESYSPSGMRLSSGHGAGATGVNAMLAFGLPTADAKTFLQAAWNAAVPTGQYRYYEGCLYMLSMLHMSGKFNLFYK